MVSIARSEMTKHAILPSYFQDDEDIDLEEIECGLYSQVYHAQFTDETTNNEYQQPPDIPGRTRRYYQDAVNYIQLPDFARHQRATDCTPVNMTFPPIVANQGSPKKQLYPEKKRKNNKWKRHKEIKRLEREMRKLEKQEHVERTHLRFQNDETKTEKVIIVTDEVINLSDEEDDCVLVTTEKTEPIECESDDNPAVIFIEPEPVPIIDLDSFSDNESASVVLPPESERKELLETPESTASNDFIENSNIEANFNFNFSLHGSEFNSTPAGEMEEFIRPQNPHADDNETESTCSTNDLNKDFNASLRSAVFNEVDFPREDMFSENNLETFANLITPQRGNLTTQTEEDLCAADKNLPELSPMNLPEESSSQSKKHNKENKRKKKKRKSLVENVEESCPVEEDLSKRKKTTDVEAQPDPVVEEKPNDETQEAQLKLLDGLDFVVIDEVGQSDLDNSVCIIEPVIECVNISDCDDEENLVLANCSEPPEEVAIAAPTSNHPPGFGEKWHPDQLIYHSTISDPNFDVKTVQNTMKDDPKYWNVLAADKFPSTSYPRGPRCHSCRENGHFSNRCPNKKEVQCSLCGLSGHYMPSCPNKLCTQCGNPGNFTTPYCWKCVPYATALCNICKMFGHISDKCADLWRRYHLTTEAGPLVATISPQLKSRNEWWCSGCGQRGHLEQTCNYLNRVYPPCDIAIHKYEDVYGYVHPSTLPRILEQQRQPSPVQTSSNQKPHQIGTNTNKISSSNPKLLSKPYSKYFMTKSLEQIQILITNNVKSLNKITESPKCLLKELFLKETLARQSKPDLMQYKVLCKKLNMYLFGIHKLKEGEKHLNYLEQILTYHPNGKMSQRQREQLFVAFNYIFSNEKHEYLNYKKMLQVLVIRDNRKRM